MKKYGKTQINVGNGFFVSALTILFIYLKLTNAITWSWIWVLSPLWISLALVLLVLLVVFLMAVIE